MPPLAPSPSPSAPPPAAGFPNSPASQTMSHAHQTPSNHITNHATDTSRHPSTMLLLYMIHSFSHLLTPSPHYLLLLLSSSLPQHPQITKSTSPGLHRNKSATISITNGRCNAIDVGNAAAIVRTWLRPPPGRASAPCPGRSTGPEMACILHLTKPE